ncbi:mtcA2, partial [Symbiodinium pilosum]
VFAMSFFSQLTGALTMCSSPDVRPGRPLANRTNSVICKELVAQGQAPHTAIVGCADSRAPLETIFDTMPGDIFVLRNAGNTCTHAEGSIVGSLEFCAGNLGSRLVLVLGHTKTFLDLGVAAHQAQEEMGPGADSDAIAAHAVKVNVFHTMNFLLSYSEAKLIAHAVKVNVFHSMNFLLKFSEPLRDLVRKGNLQIQGGIYHLETGRVEFLGRSPQQAELLSSKRSVPPSIQCGTGPHCPEQASDAAGPPEHACGFVQHGPKLPTLVGCADSRVPLETVFDALPGDLFVLRNAGNTCTHAEGSVLGSLEFCTGALIFVLGHTACGAIKGATKAFSSSPRSP